MLKPAPVPTHRRERWALVAVLGCAGVLATATAVPGAFNIDESNYLASLVALRAGRVTMPGTEGLPPTTELLWFDPVDRWRTVETTPVAPLTPPLYAPLALPFSWFGWRGLVGLNILAFVSTAVLVFAWVRRLSVRREAAWIAVAAFALGSPQLEYAQGVWPHELAMLLVFGAGYLAYRVRDGHASWVAVLAGALVGLAGGVRHQNLFVAGWLGLGLVLLVPRERRLAVALHFGLGLAAPVLVASSINLFRVGHFHPAWKGTVSYLSLGAGVVSGGPGVLEALHVLWAKIVDFSAHPAFTGERGRWHGYLHKEELTGAFLVLGGAVKKAWLQSSPWLGLSFVALAAGGWKRTGEPSGRRELHAIGLVLVPVLALFAMAGFARTDGLCYNQRYFQELLPFAAVALGVALGDLLVGGLTLGIGAFAGLGLAAIAFLVQGDNVAGLDLAMRVPLGLAASLALLWPLRSRPWGARATSALLGASIAWAFGAHVFDDVRAANGIRLRHLGQARELASVLPQRAGVLVWLNHKIGLGPLVLERDLVIADPSADDARATPAVVGRLLEQGRPVFLVANRYPEVFLADLRRVFSFREVTTGGSGRLEVFELTKRTPLAEGAAR